MPVTFLRLAASLVLVIALAACGGGGQSLAPGLSQRMDSPGAQLDRTSALAMLNQYRASVGAGPLTDDPTLDATATNFANTYSATGHQTPKPDGTVEVRYSAGPATFADVFSAWRADPQHSSALSDKAVTRAGIAAVYNPNSPYGIYWAMIVG